MQIHLKDEGAGWGNPPYPPPLLLMHGHYAAIMPDDNWEQVECPPLCCLPFTWCGEICKKSLIYALVLHSNSEIMMPLINNLDLKCVASEKLWADFPSDLWHCVVLRLCNCYSKVSEKLIVLMCLVVMLMIEVIFPCLIKIHCVLQAMARSNQPIPCSTFNSDGSLYAYAVCVWTAVRGLSCEIRR